MISCAVDDAKHLHDSRHIALWFQDTEQKAIMRPTAPEQELANRELVIPGEADTRAAIREHLKTFHRGIEAIQPLLGRCWRDSDEA
jgi:hypothetical protein